MGIQTTKTKKENLSRVRPHTSRRAPGEPRRSQANQGGRDQEAPRGKGVGALRAQKNVKSAKAKRQGSSGKHKRVLKRAKERSRKATGSFRSAQESQEEPRRAEESSRRAAGDRRRALGEPRRAQENQGAVRRAHGLSGEPRRATGGP